jgi:hypothetical protein
MELIVTRDSRDFFCCGVTSMVVMQSRK